jgi:hypothetical protein
VIVDLAEGGKTYTLAEFARLYKDAKAVIYGWAARLRPLRQ